MHLTRRDFLASSSLALLASPSLAQSSGRGQTLKAKVTDIQLLPEKYGKTAIWGFDGRTPGSEIRVAQGARVQRRLVNDLPQATSVHWHGIRISNSMDGVSGSSSTDSLGSSKIASV